MTYADDISGTGWLGTGGSQNWGYYNNWTGLDPYQGERNLLFGNAWNNAGRSGETRSYIDQSGYNGYGITFQDNGPGNNVTFTLDGNNFSLSESSTNSPYISNGSYVQQNINVGVTFGSATGQAYLSAYHGDTVFSYHDVTVSSGTTLTVNGTAGSGSIRINGTLTSANAVNLDSTGTLGGSGTINAGINVFGTITANGATVTGVNNTATTIGTLHTGGESWNAGGTMLIKAASPTNSDQLVMSGLSSVLGSGTGSKFTVAVTAATPFKLPSGTPMVLADDSNSAHSGTNPFAALLSSLTLALTNVSDSNSSKSLGLYTVADGTGGYDLVLDDTQPTATPEPTSALLLALAAGPLVIGRRRVRPADR